MRTSTPLFLAHLGLVTSQNTTQTNSSSIPLSIIPTPTQSIGLNGSTVANPVAYTTAFELNLDQYWDLFVGPVSTANVNMTVPATPVATNELIPPPGLYYSSFPT